MSLDSNATVGIYIPTKNRRKLLEKAIESVVAQSYTNFKLIVVNDGSTDDTQSYLDSISDSRISSIQFKHSVGACKARNTAIEALDTELVTGLDDDDLFLPNRLEELLKVYDENYAFVCSGYYWDYGAYQKRLFSRDKIISLSDAFDLNQCSNQILVARKRVIEVGGFDEKIAALQDHDLWIRLIASFGSAFRTGKALYVVNSDHNLERISSIENKLKAIDLFEKKHFSIMLDRNKKNFEFYRQKIAGEPFTFWDFIKSSRYGLVRLKFRLYIARAFKGLSKLRLKYLQSGRFFGSDKND